MKRVAACWAAILAVLAASAAAAAEPRLSLRESFRIGDAGVLCTAQAVLLDKTVRTMFDRGYRIVCSDAAAPVGTLYVLRGGAARAAEVAANRAPDIACDAAQPAAIEGLPEAASASCKSHAAVAWRSYTLARGDRFYVAEGLGGYDSALQLGLRAIVADRPVAGEVQVASTGAGDTAAFARIQAGNLDEDAALTEAYARNNSGSFAESAEFFERLSQSEAGAAGGGRQAEYLANQALQQSNLGNFAAAEDLFERARQKLPAGDPVTTRLLRNFRAMHRLNQRDAGGAIAELDTPAVPIAPIDDAAFAQGEISPALAEAINRENASLRRIGVVDERLSPAERAAILDGQALQQRGVSSRLQGDYPAALRMLQEANARLGSVREGRVTSTVFLLSQGFAEMGLVHEALGDTEAATRDFSESVRPLAIYFPDTVALLSAQARYAAFLGRTGRADQALVRFDEVVASSQRVPGSGAAIRDQLAPYFALLAPKVGSDAATARKMFAATQVLIRPGIAQTQATFARQLSAGDDEAARLFRESLNQSREIMRLRTQVSQMIAANQQDQASYEPTNLRLAGLEQAQTALQAKLADYPRYRVLSPTSLDLAELQRSLRPGEAYFQLRMVGGDAYAMLVRADRVQAAKLAAGAADIDAMVEQLRQTIVVVVNGQANTYPFDMALSRRLYLALFEGFDGPLGGVDHLIFDPDGALMALPLNLLVTDQASVERYAARTSKPGADEFDFTGTAWLGRDREVTTAVGPQAFVDIRKIPPSRAARSYLGLGHNALPPAAMPDVAAAGEESCAWPLAAWRKPIAEDELRLASRRVGGGTLITGAAFTDSGLRQRGDLDQYRIIHFATHGLLTAPRPECPAQPALLSSFGPPGESDGLLSFQEIFDLRLDADLVLLSACDTAGSATVAATREAGLGSGGDFALDGLVRSFVGAGARTVIASHWPVPDEYDATQRLVLGLFDGPPGTSIGAALRSAERKLMDDPKTSHPFYWAAFAIVGDGERPVR